MYVWWGNQAISWRKPSLFQSAKWLELTGCQVSWETNAEAHYNNGTGFETYVATWRANHSITVPRFLYSYSCRSFFCPSPNSLRFDEERAVIIRRFYTAPLIVHTPSTKSTWVFFFFLTRPLFFAPLAARKTNREMKQALIEFEWGQMKSGGEVVEKNKQDRVQVQQKGHSRVKRTGCLKMLGWDRIRKRNSSCAAAAAIVTHVNAAKGLNSCVIGGLAGGRALLYYSMERCWSDEGGLQAASLVFEHLDRGGRERETDEKVEEKDVKIRRERNGGYSEDHVEFGGLIALLRGRRRRKRERNGCWRIRSFMPSKGEKKREREKGLRFRTRTASSSGSNKHVDVLLRRPTTGRREQQQRHNSRTDRKKTPVANLIDDGITQEEGRKKILKLHLSRCKAHCRPHFALCHPVGHRKTPPPPVFLPICFKDFLFLLLLFAGFERLRVFAPSLFQSNCAEKSVATFQMARDVRLVERATKERTAHRQDE